MSIVRCLVDKQADINTKDDKLGVSDCEDTANSKLVLLIGFVPNHLTKELLFTAVECTAISNN